MVEILPEEPGDPSRRSFLRSVLGRSLDAAAVLGAAAVALFITRLAIRRRRGRALIKITSADGEWLLQPAEPQEVSVAGPLGINRVQVVNGGVRVVAAPCANQICVQTGHVSRPGQWIACLPNRVFVSIETAAIVVDAVSF
jgi:hypothetical protein